MSSSPPGCSDQRGDNFPETGGIGQHGVVTPGKAFQIAQASAFAQDAEHRHQQQIPGRDAYPSTHPSIRDRLEVADQIEIGCGSNTLEHGEETIPPTSTHAQSPGKTACDTL